MVGERVPPSRGDPASAAGGPEHPVGRDANPSRRAPSRPVTRYLLANLLGALLIGLSCLGLFAAAVALLDGWELVVAASPFAFAAGVRLARLDAPAGGER